MNTTARTPGPWNVTTDGSGFICGFGRKTDDFRIERASADLTREVVEKLNAHNELVEVLTAAKFHLNRLRPLADGDAAYTLDRISAALAKIA